MPKRKNKDNDFDYISKKLKKLEEKLQRARRREESTSSSSSSEQDLQNDAGDEFSIYSRPPSPSEEVEIITSERGDEAPIDVPPPEVPAEVSTDVLPDEIIEILGEDPAPTSQYGPEIRKELADRLNHIATNGLDKEVRKELFQNKKYMVPANSERIAAPLLNMEIKAALPELVLKRDKGIEARQKQVSSVISCLARVVDTQIKNNADSKITKEIMESVRMLCDLQYSDSMRRRYFLSSCLKKEVNDHLVQTKIDKFIFGENVADTIKTAKAVSRSKIDIIKVQDNNNRSAVRKTTQPQPSTSRGLNYKAPPARRQPTQTKSRPPAPVRKPDYSSKRSRQQQQQYRNPRRD